MRGSIAPKFLVDAYNLLFWCLEGQNLERERELLIDEVNRHAKRRSLDITLVFDATRTPDPLVRSHFDALEIVFTDFGITADDHILSLIRGECVVVTSDKPLANKARHLGAKTVGTATFFDWLRKNKKKKKETLEIKKVSLEPPKVVMREGTIHWYEKVFEERLKKGDGGSREPH